MQAIQKQNHEDSEAEGVDIVPPMEDPSKPSQ